MKKGICIFFLLTVLSVGFLSAKAKLNLDIGPVYTYFSSHEPASSVRFGSGHGLWTTNTGGLNVLFGVEFVKNFGVYVTANFALGRYYWSKESYPTHYEGTRSPAGVTFAIDSQFGFFYVFHPVKKLDLTLGAGIGIGGSGYNKPLPKSQANIGGGINFNASYMFTKMVGIYGGVSDTLYAPVYTKTQISSTRSIKDTDVSGKVANSLNIKAGIRLVF